MGVGGVLHANLKSNLKDLSFDNPNSADFKKNVLSSKHALVYRKFLCFAYILTLFLFVYGYQVL